MRPTRLVVIALVAVASCKAKPPKAGAPCKSEGNVVCGDDTTRFVCTSGTWVMEHCIACSQTKSGGTTTSVYSGCVAGGIGPEGASCTGDSRDCDGNVLVKCIGGAYRRYTCGGADGCTHQMDGVHCDSSVASAGEACLHDDDTACTTDRKALLRCKSGTFALEKTCGGALGCKITPKDKDTDTIVCDATIGKVGDPCLRGAACSADKTSVLKCDQGKYVVMSRCRGATPECKLDGDRVDCADPGAGEVGDPCTEGGRCSSDGKALLICKDGAFVVQKKCRTCKLHGDEVTCTF